MVSENSSTLSIGELAKRTQIAPSAIRFYESLGLIESSRTDGGQRRYHPDALLALKYIALAKASGFTLSEIRALKAPTNHGDPLFAHWKDLAEKKLTELDQVISRAEQMKQMLTYAIECRCTKVEDCGLIS